jgi:hypothetical protein
VTDFVDALIKRKDAAKILGISLAKLDYERLDGKIAYVQYVENGCVYFTEQALKEYIARCTHRAKPLEINKTSKRHRKANYR